MRELGAQTPESDQAEEKAKKEANRAKAAAMYVLLLYSTEKIHT